jgi:hypothetical protein
MVVSNSGGIVLVVVIKGFRVGVTRREKAGMFGARKTIKTNSATPKKTTSETVATAWLVCRWAVSRSNPNKDPLISRRALARLRIEKIKPKIRRRKIRIA